MSVAERRSEPATVPLDFAAKGALTLRVRSLSKSSLQMIEVDYREHGGGGNASFPRLEDTYLIGVRCRAEVSKASVDGKVFDYSSPLGHTHCLYVSAVDFVELNTHSHTLELMLPRAFMRTVAEDLGVAEVVVLGVEPCFVVPDPIIPTLTEHLRPYLDAPETLDPLRADSFMWAFAIYVMRRYGGLTERRPRHGGLTVDQERLAKEWIEATLPVGTSLAELAGVCGLGVSRFVRAFGCSTGVSPYRWLIGRRVERTKTLLGAAFPLADIALACGFADQSHMTRTFKRATGMAPRSWQLANQLRVSEFV